MRRGPGLLVVVASLGGTHKGDAMHLCAGQRNRHPFVPSGLGDAPALRLHAAFYCFPPPPPPLVVLPSSKLLRQIGLARPGRLCGDGAANLPKEFQNA